MYSTIFLKDDDPNELYCRVCNQFFSSLHNKKEHLYGKQHLLMLTGEFERDAEQNAAGTDKLSSSTCHAHAPSTAGSNGGDAMQTQREAMLTISQFTERFLEQNLSEYTLICRAISFEQIFALCSLSALPPFFAYSNEHFTFRHIKTKLLTTTNM